MNCQEFGAHLQAYVDRELGVEETLGASVHVAECPDCGDLAEREQRFRQLLRRQPRESTPPEFRAWIVGRVRRSSQFARLRRWLAVPGLAMAGLLAGILLSGGREPAPLLGQLVDAHIAYAQIERPAEFASTDRLEVKEWLWQRAGLRATVPDYSPAGIRLVGARIAVANERKAAYLLYEKGHTLLSVFMVPVSGRNAELTGTRVSYLGRDYTAREWKGNRTVTWTERGALFSLVSMLDYEALLECADRLRVERASQARL